MASAAGSPLPGHQRSLRSRGQEHPPPKPGRCSTPRAHPAHFSVSSAFRALSSLAWVDNGSVRRQRPPPLPQPEPELPGSLARPLNGIRRAAEETPQTLRAPCRLLRPLTRNTSGASVRDSKPKPGVSTQARPIPPKLCLLGLHPPRGHPLGQPGRAASTVPI